LKTKDVVAGLGEIGNPILKLFSKVTVTIGYDVKPQLVIMHKLKKYENLPTQILHICIQYDNNFV